MHFSSLEELKEHIGDCGRCSLSEGRTHLVFGTGDPHARVMFVGEAPGRNEDLQGEPFVGAAGKLLDQLLASIGLSRSDVYIANVLKCRPPGNRDPLPSEVETCTPFLEEQIRLVDPEIVVTLGNHATKRLLKTTRGISGLRGRLFRVAGRQVIPMFHPAVALYDPRQKDVLFEDFRRLKAVLERGPSAIENAPEGDEQGRGGVNGAGPSQAAPSHASRREGGGRVDGKGPDADTSGGGPSQLTFDGLDL